VPKHRRASQITPLRRPGFAQYRRSSHDPHRALLDLSLSATLS
jgi:hypothetical protein